MARNPTIDQIDRLARCCLEGYPETYGTMSQARASVRSTFRALDDERAAGVDPAGSYYVFR